MRDVMLRARRCADEEIEDPVRGPGGGAATLLSFVIVGRREDGASEALIKARNGRPIRGGDRAGAALTSSSRTIRLPEDSAGLLAAS